MIGLIYVDELDGFGYHMWDEVFVNDRWVAIDPSFDQTTVDAVHIKLSDTSLDGRCPVRGVPAGGRRRGQADDRADRDPLNRSARDGPESVRPTSILRPAPRVLIRLMRRRRAG